MLEHERLGPAIASMFEEALIDEAQDLNALQIRIVGLSAVTTSGSCS